MVDSMVALRFFNADRPESKQVGSKGNGKDLYVWWRGATNCFAVRACAFSPSETAGIPDMLAPMKLRLTVMHRIRSAKGSWYVAVP